MDTIAVGWLCLLPWILLLLCPSGSCIIPKRIQNDFTKTLLENVHTLPLTGQGHQQWVKTIALLQLPESPLQKFPLMAIWQYQSKDALCTSILWMFEDHLVYCLNLTDMFSIWILFELVVAWFSDHSPTGSGWAADPSATVLLSSLEQIIAKRWDLRIIALYRVFSVLDQIQFKALAIMWPLVCLNLVITS